MLKIFPLELKLLVKIINQKETNGTWMIKWVIKKLFEVFNNKETG